MSPSAITTIYIAAAVLFILSLGGLSGQKTARRGNMLGIIGMLIALVATAASPAISGTGYAALAVAVIPAALIGATLAARVKMTEMPELVALLHSFVGAAAVLVGIASFLTPTHHDIGTEATIHLVEIFIGVCVGSVTFTGSIIAFLKLRGTLSGKPLIIPGRHALNITILLATVGMGILFVRGGNGQQDLLMLLAATVLTGAAGAHLIAAIGGADMPVVVSMLNSYSGWAASAAGFMLSNDLLIITGALVGSSGAILSLIMCRGMNRSFFSVILGGFGGDGGHATPSKSADGAITEISIPETAQKLRDAGRVIIVPGYGMAVAQAQRQVSGIVELLQDIGVKVRFAIHPVAGRLPGHMNVLLAEANISYDIVLEMDEINSDFPETDVVMVIGANDIVNPSAQTDAGSPIAGMPVLEVWKSKLVIVLKRSLASGYAGVGNPLFFMENTRMQFGDAKEVTAAILTELQASKATTP